MNPMGLGANISEGEWGSLASFSGSCCAEEADFMALLLNNASLPSELTGDSSSSLEIPSSTFWLGHDSYNISSNFYGFSNGSTGGSSSQLQSYYLSDSSHPIFVPNNNSMDLCMADVRNTNSFLIEGDDSSFLNQEKSSDGNNNAEDQSSAENVPAAAALPPKKDSQLKSKSEILPVRESIPEEKCDNNPTDQNISKKRSRTSGEVGKNKRNVRSKKNQKTSNNEEENINAGQEWSSCSSEDDCNTSRSSAKGPTTSDNVKGKTRASRGSATDPQSLYARKRRERINERLRILQNLIPNGTKVDISTMLEEAVQYVKFLQLQIKLLSSDDLWMYSPIAYNGMDIGLLDMKINPPRQSS